MKLGTLKTSGRDGKLIVVSQDLKHAFAVPRIALTLQSALDNWHHVAPQLRTVYEELNRAPSPGFELDIEMLRAPLPRAYQFLDGSAYLSHVERIRKARDAEMPRELQFDPLMYQGVSDTFLGPRDPIEARDENWGIDFESEVAIITDDVPMGGVTPGEAALHIKLFMLLNDVSLRKLIPAELAKGFGFVQSKPASACSPVAVTPDELGDAWDGAHLNLPLETRFNGALFGNVNAGDDMNFSFCDLMTHAAKTRRLSAGTVIGSGTVSNSDPKRGFSCIVEKRCVEIVENGEAKTPFMSFGDTVRIEMFDDDDNSIFGAIEQVVKPYHP